MMFPTFQGVKSCGLDDQAPRCFARRASHGQHSASVPIKRSGPPIADGPLTMCFSATASFSASAVLVGLGSLAWQAAPTRRDLPFAAIPLLFAGQQLIEGLLWLSFDSGATGLQGALTAGYAFFSQVFWPVYVPLAALLLEPSAARRRALRLLLAIGAAVSAWLLWQTLAHGVTARPSGAHIEYVTSDSMATLATTLYVLATAASLLLSTLPAVKLFGAATLLAFVVTYVVYAEWLISVWCGFEAVLSVLVLLHFKVGRQRPRNAVA